MNDLSVILGVGVGGFIAGYALALLRRFVLPRMRR